MTEYANGSHGTGGLYPYEWGTPPGERFSETRALWVRCHVHVTELPKKPGRDAVRRYRRLLELRRDAPA